MGNIINADDLVIIADSLEKLNSLPGSIFTGKKTFLM